MEVQVVALAGQQDVAAGELRVDQHLGGLAFEISVLIGHDLDGAVVVVSELARLLGDPGVRPAFDLATPGVGGLDDELEVAFLVDLEGELARPVLHGDLAAAGQVDLAAEDFVLASLALAEVDGLVGHFAHFDQPVKADRCVVGVLGRDLESHAIARSVQTAVGLGIDVKRLVRDLDGFLGDDLAAAGVDHLRRDVILDVLIGRLLERRGRDVQHGVALVVGDERPLGDLVAAVASVVGPPVAIPRAKALLAVVPAPSPVRSPVAVIRRAVYFVSHLRPDHRRAEVVAAVERDLHLIAQFVLILRRGDGHFVLGFLVLLDAEAAAGVPPAVIGPPAHADLDVVDAQRRIGRGNLQRAADRAEVVGDMFGLVHFVTAWIGNRDVALDLRGVLVFASGVLANHLLEVDRLARSVDGPLGVSVDAVGVAVAVPVPVETGAQPRVVIAGADDHDEVAVPVVPLGIEAPLMLEGAVLAGLAFDVFVDRLLVDVLDEPLDEHVRAGHRLARDRIGGEEQALLPAGLTDDGHPADQHQRGSGISLLLGVHADRADDVGAAVGHRRLDGGAELVAVWSAAVPFVLVGVGRVEAPRRYAFSVARLEAAQLT